MTLKFSSSELYKVLQIGQLAIPSKPVIPVLYDFVFEVNDGILSIKACDLEFTIISTMPMQGVENGAFSFPAEILLSTLRELPEQPINLIYYKETSSLELVSAYGTYKASSNNLEEYPPTPDTGDLNSTNLPGNRFLKAITTCSFATTNDESRANMMGISMRLKPDAIELAATDAHKLVKFTLFHNNEIEDYALILPKKITSILKNCINDDSPLIIEYNRNHAIFSVRNIKIYCKLIDLVFPNYNGVIPVNNPIEIIVNRNNFLQSLKRTAIYGNKTTNQLTFTIENNQLSLYALDIDFSNEASEVIACQYEGERLELNYNSKHLIESLTNLHAEDVRLSLAGPTKPAVLTPKENELGENVLMIVMPVLRARRYGEDS